MRGDDSIDDGLTDEDLERFGGDTMACPHCGDEVYDEAPYCPACGEPLDESLGARPPAAQEHQRRLTAAIAILLAVAFLAMVLGISLF